MNGAYQVGLHRFALATCAWTLFLLLAGAFVTSTGSALAVPDWPLSFGKFFPEMTGGVFYEHGHRMVAGIAALMTLGLAIALQLRDGRSWVRRLGWTAVAVVLLQASLGGMTVLLRLPTQVSVSHAGLAQVFFGLTVALALVTSRSWVEEGALPTAPAWNLPRWSLVAVLAVYLQTLMGAVTRHLGAGLAVPDFPHSFGAWIPPHWSYSILFHFLHTRVGALIVLVFVTVLAYRVCSAYPSEKRLFLPAAAAGLLVWFQCLLGLSILLTHKEVVPTSAHLALGAALMGSLLVLTLNAHRLFRKA